MQRNLYKFNSVEFSSHLNTFTSSQQHVQQNYDFQLIPTKAFFQVHDSKVRIKMILLILICSPAWVASTCFVFPRVTLDCGSPLRACVWVWDVIRECVCGAGEPHECWILQCSRENDHTHHSNAKSTSVPTTFHSFFSLSPCHPFLPSSHLSSSSLSFLLVTLVRSALLTHFTAACKGARDSDTHFHASLINTEGTHLFYSDRRITPEPIHHSNARIQFADVPACRNG